MSKYKKTRSSKIYQKQLFNFPFFCLSGFLLGCSGPFTQASHPNLPYLAISQSSQLLLPLYLSHQQVLAGPEDVKREQSALGIDPCGSSGACRASQSWFHLEAREPAGLNCEPSGANTPVSRERRSEWGFKSVYHSCFIYFFLIWKRFNFKVFIYFTNNKCTWLTKKKLKRCVKCLQFSSPEATTVKNFWYILSKVVYRYLSLPFYKANHGMYACYSAPCSLHLTIKLTEYSISSHRELHHHF